MRLSDKLRCVVQQLHYNAELRVGTIWTPAASSVDMVGAIEVFSAIDSAVRQIDVYVADEPDTRFINSTGEWVVKRLTSAS